jgi:membrane protein implicated in regulation of membrane protease activity
MQDFVEWLRDHQWETWLGLSIVLGVAEMFSLDLILIMLAGGALVGMLAALLGLPGIAQVLLAAGASVAALALVRPSVVRRLHSGPELTLGHGKLVGARGVVTQTVSSLETGRVKLAGELWSAEPYDDSLVIEPGEVVEVLEIRGATAFVHPLPALER